MSGKKLVLYSQASSFDCSCKNTKGHKSKSLCIPGCWAIVVKHQFVSSPIDSWSSASSRDGSLPQTDPTTWVKGDLDEANSRSPDAAEVSSSLVEQPGNFVVTGNECTGSTAISNIATNAPKKQSTTVVNNRKAKLRAAFSEAQMNILVQRFSVQRYLSPGEMKSLAEVTGLTYKQVRGWQIFIFFLDTQQGGML